VIVRWTEDGSMNLSTISRILGGRKTLHIDIRDRMDLVELGRRGVTKAALLKLAGYLDLSVSEMAALLPVGERTIQRYARTHRFKSSVSEHILQIAQVAARGEEVFGEKDRFLAWLGLPSAALGNSTPEELLSSRFGAELVLDELGRMEHGVVA
jgi:putative toxin-antitoxin system antitoxin component (TIGR02293 family)